MNEIVQNGENQKIQELENARLGYETAVDLAGKVSQEIYNRFGVMLIVHVLLLTSIFDYLNNSKFLSILATLIGFILCPIWMGMILHGFFYQDRYHKIARKLEDKYFCCSFRIFSSEQYPNQDLVEFAPLEEGKSCFKNLKEVSAKIRFEVVSVIIICIFWLLYTIMLLKIIEIL